MKTNSLLLLLTISLLGFQGFSQEKNCKQELLEKMKEGISFTESSKEIRMIHILSESGSWEDNQKVKTNATYLLNDVTLILLNEYMDILMDDEFIFTIDHLSKKVRKARAPDSKDSQGITLNAINQFRDSLLQSSNIIDCECLGVSGDACKVTFHVNEKWKKRTGVTQGTLFFDEHRNYSGYRFEYTMDSNQKYTQFSIQNVEENYSFKGKLSAQAFFKSEENKRYENYEFND